MNRLLKREWTSMKNSALKSLLPGFILSLLVLIIYKINKAPFLAVMRGIYRCPKEFYQFLGIEEGMATGSFTFYLLFFAMFIGFWLVWDSSNRMIKSVYGDVCSDELYSLMNQLYSRKQLAFGKYGGALIVSVLQVTVWNAALILFVILGNAISQQRNQGIWIVFRLYVISLAVHIFIISLSFVLAVWRARRGRSFSPDGILFGSLLIGNSWKIRDLLVLIFAKLSVPVGKIVRIERMFSWLDKLYWISPLSWMNPLQLQTGKLFLVQILLLLAASGILALTGVRLYGPAK